jgi:hypothetical protein
MFPNINVSRSTHCRGMNYAVWGKVSLGKGRRHAKAPVS